MQNTDNFPKIGVGMHELSIDIIAFFIFAFATVFSAGMLVAEVRGLRRDMDDSARRMEDWKRTVWDNETKYRTRMCERIKKVKKSVD